MTPEKLIKQVEQSHKIGALLGNEGWGFLKAWLEDSVNFCKAVGVSGKDQRELDTNAGAYAAYQSVLDLVENTKKRGEEAKRKLEELQSGSN